MDKERMREIFEHISDFPVKKYETAIEKWGKDMNKVIEQTTKKLTQNLLRIVEDAKTKGLVE